MYGNECNFLGLSLLDKLNPYIGQRTLIIGDVNTGKTDRTLEIMQLFLKEGYAKKIAILDMGIEPVQDIGGKNEAA